jgi:hypothetical protein
MAPSLRLVTTSGGPADIEIDEARAATVIAETLREQAAHMPLNSDLRGLALRSASHWSTIAGCTPVALCPPPLKSPDRPR